MIHREPILSSLAAGPPPQQTAEAGTRAADNESSSSAKRASTRLRKTTHWPECDVGEVPSSVPVSVVDQDAKSRDRQLLQIRTKSSGQYIGGSGTVRQDRTRLLLGDHL